jgi:thiosulfate reductase cytochrome b subunit
MCDSYAEVRWLLSVRISRQTAGCSIPHLPLNFLFLVNLLIFKVLVVFNSPLLPHFRHRGGGVSRQLIGRLLFYNSPFSDKFSFPHFFVDNQSISTFQFPFISPFPSQLGVCCWQLSVWPFCPDFA